MLKFTNSELILNENKKIYHLDIAEKDIAEKIITVGDPGRVGKVASFLDKILFKHANREYITVTGIYKNEKITIISTGIGAGNIDIVMNELDALCNIDFNTRKLKSKRKSLTILRIGTSGGFHPKLHCDDLLVSAGAIGMDGFIYHYLNSEQFYTSEIRNFENKIDWNPLLAKPYICMANQAMTEHFMQSDFKEGITVTSNGFYAAQNRDLRLPSNWGNRFEKLQGFEIQNTPITNLEMETAAIYALGQLMGHRTLSCNAILADRLRNQFSQNPEKTIVKLIQKSLDLLVSF